MARKVRIRYPGVIYHVMNRGDRRQAIFGDDEDRQRLLQPQELALGPLRSMPPGNMTISLTPAMAQGQDQRKTGRTMRPARIPIYGLTLSMATSLADTAHAWAEFGNARASARAAAS
jgi:hypothetical protein